MVKYILTGATGGLGSRVFKHLIRLVPASDVIFSLYNPAGATPEMKASGVEIRHGDFLRPSTLDAAFEGGDKLLLVSHPSMAGELRTKIHGEAIEAAKRAGVKHVYYTSLGFGGDSRAAVMQGHLGTEAYLKKGGVTYTIIREGIYSEAWPFYFGYWHPGRGSDVKVPYGDGGIAYACKDDLGEGTAKLMVEDTHKNEIVRFTGSKAWTLSELAKLITSTLHINPPLRLKVVSLEDWIAYNQAPPDLLTRWATTYPALKRGECAVVDPLLKELLGREPEPFEETVREMLVAEDEEEDWAVRW